MFLFQYSTELSLYELVESIKGRNQLNILLYLFKKQVDRH